MLSIGEVLHSGISVRGDRNLRNEDATRSAAAPSLNAWQDNQARNLPEGAKFGVFERVTPNGSYATVTRYLTVVDAGA